MRKTLEELRNQSWICSMAIQEGCFHDSLVALSLNEGHAEFPAIEELTNFCQRISLYYHIRTASYSMTEDGRFPVRWWPNTEIAPNCQR